MWPGRPDGQGVNVAPEHRVGERPGPARVGAVADVAVERAARRGETRTCLTPVWNVLRRRRAETGRMMRGSPAIYLEAELGTGGTHDMPSEDRRRAGRGTDVVVGLADAPQVSGTSRPEDLG